LLLRQNFGSKKKDSAQVFFMAEKFEEPDRLQLAQYCEKHFRQKTHLPKAFLDASFDELVKFLHHEGRNVEDIFLEIFLENTPDPLDSE